jgi:23S rRNA (cytidine1920-2'-O)/16S rRNA (cytidine1409-2'-O)-methyltransferase
VTKERIDKILVDRGLADTRSRAQAMVLTGVVLVADQRVDKPGQMVSSDAEIRIKGETLKYVSRGGLKLEAALNEFKINPENKRCLDVGASTGGFTDCMLQRGAASVLALDVGHNQLAWKIRTDPRVEVIEGFNARQISRERFHSLYDLATIDVSFISLDKILPAVSSVVSDDADIVALIKPQFEVGKGQVGKGGIVKDPEKHRAVLRQVGALARSMSLATLCLIDSPILGAEGNREFLIHLRRSKSQAELNTPVLDDFLSQLK